MRIQPTNWAIRVANRTLSAPWRRLLWAMGVAAALTVAVAVWLHYGFGGPGITTAMDDLVQAVVPLGVAVVCWRASRRHSGRARSAWVLLGAACLSWGIGQVIWTVYEVVLHLNPFPSLADPFFLGMIPLAAAGLLLFTPSPRALTTQARTVIDGLIVWGSLFFLSWALVLGPVYQGSPADLLGRLLSISYPAGDVVLTAIVLIVLARTRRSAALVCISAGLVALALADSAFAFLSLKGTYGTGNAMDAGWIAGFLLIGLAALWPPRDPLGVRSARHSRLAIMLPYAAFPPGMVLAAVGGVQGESLGPVLTVTGMVVLVLVLVRQMLVLRDNIALNRDLEAKVEVRTAELARSQERFRSLVQNSSDVIMILGDDLGIQYVTSASERVLGYAPELLVGRSFGAWIPEQDRRDVESALARVMAAPRAATTVTHRLPRADGSSCECESIVANLLDDPSVRGLVVTARDVGERTALEDELRQMAFHDGLTGLANRALFADRVQHALDHSARTGLATAVMMIDLDDFKGVNDTLGHDAGDELLQVVAQLLVGKARRSDTVARLGGDEFAVLIEDVPDAAEPFQLGQRLLDALKDPVVVQRSELFVSASIGIALANTGLEEVADLLRDADTAMYNAKQSGKARVAAFKAGMHEQLVRRSQLKHDLRRAMDAGELRILYQPTVDLSSGALEGVEALLRWHHPQLGVISPLEFIPLAEETGLIVPIGAWVLREACRQARSWDAEAPQAGRLSVNVNVSGRQLEDEVLVEDVRAALAETSLDPGRLVLEITESVLLKDWKSSLQRLERLRGLGVRLAIDDFGTGYSSLSYLDRLPVDVIKIDKAFVDRLSDAKDASLVESIVQMSQVMGLKTIAEGIEAPGQAARLHEASCDLGQGYLFGRPTEPERIGALLTGRASLRDDVESGS